MIIDGGPGTGLYKTTDGGAHWKELNNGLPKGPMGRIGIDICLTRPKTLYAVYDNHNMRPNPRNKYDTINGQVFRTDDAGASWRRVNPDDVDVSGKAATHSIRFAWIPTILTAYGSPAPISITRLTAARRGRPRVATNASFQRRSEISVRCGSIPKIRCT